MLRLIAEANYARLEARFYQVDFGQLSYRKALNLTFDYLFESVGHDEEKWNRTYAPIFSPDDDRSIDDPDGAPAAGTSVQLYPARPAAASV